MNDNSVRNQIICPYNYEIRSYDNLSNIELAAKFSKNENNFKIFKNLLFKINKNEQLINELLMTTIYNISSTASNDAIKLLIKYVTNIDYREKDTSWSSLIYCCIYGNDIKIFKLLIDNGANLNY